jgi:hypothetical protein
MPLEIVEIFFKLKNLTIFICLFEKFKVKEKKFCELPRNSAELNGIPQTGIPQPGIPHTSAEFLLILHRIRNVC